MPEWPGADGRGPTGGVSALAKPGRLPFNASRSRMKITRRSFIRQAALALPITVAATRAGAQGVAVRTPAAVAGPAEYFDRKTRLTISMWDFSWLHAGHPGGAYADLERRVVEAVERGYNTLRVDCFPSRLLEPESRFEKNWNPGVDLPSWGQRAVDFSCDVRRKVAQLAGLCRQHGLWLGLDSWDKGHMFSRAQNGLNGDGQPIAVAAEERAFTGYGETWVKALKLMREEGVLERAVWIAPMNEVPHFAGRQLAALAQLPDQPLEEGETQLRRNQAVDAVYRRINRWMAEPIKAEVARDGIPLSYSSLGMENYAARLPDLYDVVDVHFMPSVIMDAADRQAFAAVGPGVLKGRFAGLRASDLAAFSQAWDRACRKHYPSMLRRVQDYHQAALQQLTLPSGKKLAAIITESFGPCFWPDHPSVGWDWYQRYNADALRVVAGMDFKGSSLSNYAEPGFSLWGDRDWHWTSNAFFQAALRP